MHSMITNHRNFLVKQEYGVGKPVNGLSSKQMNRTQLLNLCSYQLRCLHELFLGE